MLPLKPLKHAAALHCLEKKKKKKKNKTRKILWQRIKQSLNYKIGDEIRFTIMPTQQFSKDTPQIYGVF